MSERYIPCGKQIERKQNRRKEIYIRFTKEIASSRVLRKNQTNFQALEEWLGRSLRSLVSAYREGLVVLTWQV